MKIVLMLSLFTFGFLNFSFGTTLNQYALNGDISLNEIDTKSVNSIDIEKTGVYKKIKQFFRKAKGKKAIKNILWFGVISTLIGTLMTILGYRWTFINDNHDLIGLSAILYFLGALILTVGALVLGIGFIIWLLGLASKNK